ncbi:hypothetical protein [Nostoc sp. JL31]|uniref:hypothetical protein n=1 Tax=Nostoc sp. JL31 TaxID=2815395 RepID=UPI0025F0DE5E|nr:hypothetical protein [Nostoc sp. JL31]
MTTVIFVHGTGIREREYNETFQIIEQKIRAQRPDIKVSPCLWGVLGAKFNDNRASVPLGMRHWLYLSQKKTQILYCGGNYTAILCMNYGCCL